jgi:6-phospho-3-hexuloisomerase
MSIVNSTALTEEVGASLALIGRELDSVTDWVGRHSGEDLEALAEAIVGAERIFVLGAGRSGLALQMTAMRLMHLGFVVHVVGEVTAPAIGPNDVLLTASGSGTTGAIVRSAEVAAAVGADVVAITAAAASPLAGLASVLVVVPAAGKLDRSASVSAQYAGSLFEQTLLLLGDAVFHTLWARSAKSADELWPRHANLE